MIGYQDETTLNAGTTASVGHGLRLLVANPAAMVVTQGARVAVGHGLDRDGQMRLREILRQPEPGTALGQLVAEQDEATVVLADAEASGGASLDAWRGATSNFEVYLADAGTDRPPTISDHFRDALALIPRTRRTLDPKAIADHVLFGGVPCTRTYVSSVGRLGHGEHLRWHRGETKRDLFDRLVAEPRPDRAPLDDIDTALERRVGRLPVAEDCANQLSGGVDSCLLQTYLPARTPTVCSVIDSPEVAWERAYGEQAHRILGTSHKEFVSRESDYLDMLVESIRLIGMPFRQPQLAVYNRMFRFPVAHFVCGEFADSLFGLTPRSEHIAAYRQRYLLRLAEFVGSARVLPPRKALGLRNRIDRMRRVEHVIDNWQGLALQYSVFTNRTLAERMLGTSTMKQHIEARAAYVMERFRSEERNVDPLFTHLEFGHMISLLTSGTFAIHRQLAHSNGKGVLAPFAGRSMVAAALAVPCDRRYVEDGRVKHLLKDLLKRRFPAFDVDARKAGGNLPRKRYFTSGPLMNVFERYAMPDFVDGDVAAATRAAPDWLTWNLLSLAIWRDEVQADPTFAPLPSTRVVVPSHCNIA